MPLTLTLAGSGGREARTIDRGTLSIGRAPGNDWVLADPDRQLSKTHCVIAAAGGRYVLTDLSTNGVFVNGAAQRVPRDGQVELTDGDEFRLGEHLIQVAESMASAAPAVPFATPEPPPDPLGNDPLGGDPLDLFDAPGFAPAAGFSHPIAAPPPVLRAADPFDLADSDPPQGGLHARPQGRPQAHPLDDDDDDLMRGIVPVDPWSGPAQADNVDAPLQAFTAPKALLPTNFDDLDFDALLGDTPPGQSVPAPPAAAAPRPVPAPMPAPAPRAAPAAAPSSDPFAEAPPPPRAAATAPPPPAAPAVPADAARLLAAFLDGAGVPSLTLGADPETALRDAGALFRAFVDGIRQVLISRASIKNEFRVEQTMLRARDNNALKFSVTTEDAIAALLVPGRPGYKPPLAATKEAFADVQSHEMAVMAAVQTALMGLLHRFEPGELEKRLQPGGLGNFLPAARKAQTWELFCTTYKQIAREAEDDFQSVFGRSFAKAYDAQMQKL